MTARISSASGFFEGEIEIFTLEICIVGLFAKDYACAAVAWLRESATETKLSLFNDLAILCQAWNTSSAFLERAAPFQIFAFLLFPSQQNVSGSSWMPFDPKTAKYPGSLERKQTNISTFV